MLCVIFQSKNNVEILLQGSANAGEKEEKSHTAHTSNTYEWKQ